MQIESSASLEYPQIMAKNKVLYIYLFGLWYFHNVDALKITSLDVPKNAWDAVKLNCKYDLEGGTLYGVKWYKDDIEFFRCFGDGTVQEFPLKDIKIFHTGSSQLGSCFFELTALTQKSGGEYKCEVGLDWPTFQTVSKSAYLQIIEPSKIVQPEFTEKPDAVMSSATLNKGSSSGYFSSLVIHMFLVFVILSY